LNVPGRSTIPLQPARRELQEELPSRQEVVHLPDGFFNVLNSNAVITANNSIGASLGNVTAAVGAACRGSRSR
jgi:hypothetical protein